MTGNLLSDLRCALRGLLARPLFALVAIGSLALGLGVNLALFSLFQQVALKPLDVPAAQQLFNLRAPGIKGGWISSATLGTPDEILSHPMFVDLQQAAAREGVAGLAGHRAFHAALGDDAEVRTGPALMVSGNYFDVLGVDAMIGRAFIAADDDPADPARVVLLTHATWHDQFDADPAVLGRTLRVNDAALTIVGVLPPGFSGTSRGYRATVFVPLSLAPLLQPRSSHVLDDRRSYWVYAFGRLAPGATRAAAQDALNATYARQLDQVEASLQSGLDAERLDAFRSGRVELVPGARGQSLAADDATRPLALLWTIAVLVLLIACLNIANLLLARGAERSGEFALRASIGASRARLVRQLLVEAMLLGAAGAVLAWPLAAFVTRVLVGSLPEAAAQPLDPGLDADALAYGLICALATVLLFGLLPAWRLASVRPNEALRSDGARSGPRGGNRFRASLVTAQIGLSMASLVLAGLFGKSLYNLSTVDVGMQATSIAVVTTAPRRNDADAARASQRYDRIEDALATIPGVVAVGSSRVPLMTQSTWRTSLARADGRVIDDAMPSPNYSMIGPGFLAAVGARLLDGREFTAADDVDAPPVMLVNRRFAELFELGPQPLGKRVSLGGEDDDEIEIVGIVDDAKYATIREGREPTFFLPRRQHPGADPLTYYVRAAVPPAQVLGEIRAMIEATEPAIVVEELRTLPEQIADTVAMERFVSLLSSAFALLATLLAALGLYGVMSYTLASRMHELGLRLALGAAPARLSRMVLAQVGRMTVVGVALGLVAALIAGRAAEALLFGLDGHDSLVLAAAAMVLVAVALAAGLLPARRAARIDPMVALRQ